MSEETRTRHLYFLDEAGYSMSTPCAAQKAAAAEGEVRILGGDIIGRGKVRRGEVR